MGWRIPPPPTRSRGFGVSVAEATKAMEAFGQALGMPRDFKDFYAHQVRDRYVSSPMGLLQLELDMAVAVRLDEDCFDPDVDGQVPDYLKGTNGLYLRHVTRSDLMTAVQRGLISLSEAELARSEVDELRQANEDLIEKVERATGRASELHRRLHASESARKAAEPTTAAPGSIRVRVEVAGPVEVTAMGDSVPRYLPGEVVEVVLTPEELQEAARSKFHAQRAMYPSGYVTLPDTLCDEDVLRMSREFEREWRSNHSRPALLLGYAGAQPAPDIEPTGRRPRFPAHRSWP